LIIICAEAFALSPNAIASPTSFVLWSFIIKQKCRKPIQPVKAFTVTFM
jgi:hypothetical protein